MHRSGVLYGPESGYAQDCMGIADTPCRRHQAALRPKSVHTQVRPAPSAVRAAGISSAATPHVQSPHAPPGMCCRRICAPIPAKSTPSGPRHPLANHAGPPMKHRSRARPSDQHARAAVHRHPGPSADVYQAWSRPSRAGASNRQYGRTAGRLYGHSAGRRPDGHM